MNYFADFLFRNLPTGSVITITMDSGNFIGPVIFRTYNPGAHTVVVDEQGTISPPSNTTIHLNADKIESVTFGS